MCEYTRDRTYTPIAQGGATIKANDPSCHRSFHAPLRGKINLCVGVREKAPVRLPQELSFFRPWHDLKSKVTAPLAAGFAFLAAGLQWPYVPGAW
jgi:hypothetical protein